MNATENSQAGNVADSSHELMPSMGSSKMPKRPETIVPANPNHNKTDSLMRDMGTKDSLVTGWGIDPARLAIIDSGCSSDTHPIDLTLSRPPRKFRDLIKSIKFGTVANPVVCSKDATVKYGAWGVPLDVCLSPGSLSFISVGQRVMEAGMSFFWLAGKQPCMITADYRYSVIFEINANVPVHAPCFEKLANAF